MDPTYSARNLSGFMGIKMRPWSYSRLSTWEECPKQYWYSYVEKVESTRPRSPAADRGSDIHNKAEKYLGGELDVYPFELQKVAGHTLNLKLKGAKPEVKLAAKVDWTPCDFKDSEAYYRAIIDILYVENEVCHIQDWKTGREYDSHKVQLEDYVAVVAANVEAKEYQTRLVYIDQGFVSKPVIHAADRIKPIRIMLDGRIKLAEEDTIYPVRVSPKCQWCDYSARHGGPCPH